MKQGWEIKKLGEVCDILNGYAFKSEKYTSEGVRVLRITNVQKGYVVDDAPKFYPKDEMANLQQYVLKENDLLMSLTGNVGRVGLLQNEMLPAALNQRVACLRIKTEQLYINYLFHFLNSDKFENDAIFSASGIAQKNMSTEWLKKYTIPIPPREEQERIVAELDCLSGVIEKKKQQLKELDALAQSIFYTMFGNPITNEKGWEVIHLKEAASLKAGKAIKANELSEKPKESLYPCFGGNGIRGYINKKSHYGQFPIIGRQGALCGNVVFAQGEFYATEHAVVCNNIISSINPLWLYYALKYNNLNRFAQGVAQPGISVNIINEMPLIHPPLALQQKFADKIEKIEQQKKLISQSITETEELFNSRMAYYFN